MHEVVEESRNLNNFSTKRWSWRCPRLFEKLDENLAGEVVEEAGREGRKLDREDSIG